jgi:hypothetical protein
MANPVYIELDWEDEYEPLYGSPIIIPSNTLLWRGYNIHYEAISDRYAYYSSSDIAFEYAKQSNRELGGFVTSRPLKLLDIRFMRSILSRMIQTNQEDEYISDFASCIISFGLCSLHHQIQLMKIRYKDVLKKSNEKSEQMKIAIQRMIDINNPRQIIEQEGIRIAETTNDGATMLFLQELFKGWFDGFISPRLKTVFHVEKGGELTPEMILFHPKESGIQPISHVPQHRIERPISSFIKDKHQLIDLRMMKSGTVISTKMFVTGGKRKKKLGKHPLDEFEDMIHKNDENILRLTKKAQEAGRRWRKQVLIVNPDNCTPTVECNKITDSIME